MRLECNLGYQHYTGMMIKIADRNSSLPISKQFTFPTLHDRQTNIQVELFRGERPLTRYCEYLADLNVSWYTEDESG